MALFLRVLAVVLPLGFLALAIRHWIRMRGTWTGDLGFGPSPTKLLDLGAGCSIGTLAMLGVYLAEQRLGWSHPGGFTRPGPWLIKVLPLMAAIAMFEEILNRGAVLRGLRLLLPAWAAVAGSAIIFGLGHAPNPHATVLSVLSNALGGVMYAVAFLGSGSIWLSFGLHYAWNVVQGPVLGYPVSGLDMGGLWHPVVTGPAWLTGGAYGPEGGLLGILARLGVIGLVLLYLRWTRSGPSRT